MTTWRDVLAHNAAMRDIATWPAIDLCQLSETQRRLFVKRTQMLREVLSGTSVRVVADTYGVAAKTIYQLLERTLGSHDGAAPALSNGLIAYYRVRQYKRQLPLDEAGTKSSQGAFAALQAEVPDLFKDLEARISDSVAGKANRRHYSIEALHQVFVRGLRDRHWPIDYYPFTTTSFAYESLRLWIIERRNFYRSRPSVLRTQPASHRHGPLSPITAKPFREVQIDEWLIDATFALTIKHDTGQIEQVSVSRFWLVAAVDTYSTAVLAYVFGYADNPTQYDLQYLLEQLCSIWEPLDETARGVNYSQDGGLPSGLLQAARFAAPVVLSLDNAWAHWAKHFQSFVVSRMGAVLNLGAPKQPTARHLVETLFRRIGQPVHQLPNTTGSNVRDPRRYKKNPARAAFTLSLDDCRNLMEAVICEHNATPRPDLLNYSPLARIEAAFQNGYISRQIPEDIRSSGASFKASQRCAVHPARMAGLKPYLNFAYLKYTGPCLAHFSKPKSSVAIHYDTRDIRVLEVVTLEGEHIGNVECQGKWRGFAHGLQQRKRIFKEARTRKRQATSVLDEYMENLVKQRKKPKRALELSQIKALIAEKPNDRDALHTASQLDTGLDEQRVDLPWTPRTIATAPLDPWSPRTSLVGVQDAADD
ncbi:hypothetical protein [Salinisphaera aquimarina]|uniref:Integrase catalytic domain-containing protein n=1 Tax=Salinisphaera aquimarina TaxID=2094031 RepID=A0ABV7ESH3_9GAMM